MRPDATRPGWDWHGGDCRYGRARRARTEWPRCRDGTAAPRRRAIGVGPTRRTRGRAERLLPVAVGACGRRWRAAAEPRRCAVRFDAGTIACCAAAGGVGLAGVSAAAARSGLSRILWHAAHAAVGSRRRHERRPGAAR